MRWFSAAALALVLALPAQAAPMPFEMHFQGKSRIPADFPPTHDVRIIETQDELAAFYALHVNGAVPAIDFETRRVLAIAVARVSICGLEVTVDGEIAGSAGVVTLTTHESDVCLLATVREVRVLSVPRFSGVAVFRASDTWKVGGADVPAIEVYGVDATA